MAESELLGLAEALKGLDCQLVGVSTDSVEAHRVFAESCLEGLDITLVEDRTGEISRLFKVYESTTHCTFVLNVDGEVMASFSNSFGSVTNAGEVVRLVVACQEHDRLNLAFIAWDGKTGTISRQEEQYDNLLKFWKMKEQATTSSMVDSDDGQSSVISSKSKTSPPRSKVPSIIYSQGQGIPHK